jgi:eukaryotic-like serine/threonine-protein kinase
MGTAHYIAPEQASGAEAGPASDVYSLGIVGYECLAGHRPFRADSAVAVAMMQVREAPPPLPASVPAGARELIEATLVKDPTQRYATGGEFALAVAAVRRGEPLPPLGSVTGTIAPPRTPSTPSRAAPRAAPPSAPFPAPPSSPRSSPLSAPIPTRSTPPRQARPVPAPPKSAPQVARPAPVPARRPAPDTRRNRRPQPAPAARHAAAGPSARRASSQSFRLQPKSSGRTLLLVLFVLLTLAAVAVGVLLFRGGVPPIGTVNPTPQGAGPGTVAGQEGVSTSSAVPGGLLSLVIVTGSVR